MTSGLLADLAWERLRRDTFTASAELGVPSLSLEVSTDAGPVRIAVGDEGEARILLPLRPGAAFPAIAGTRGLQVKDSVFHLNGRPTRFIDLMCKEESLEGVFKDMLASVLERIGANETATKAVEGAISDFRSLLLSSSTQEPTSEKAVGLITELLVLHRILRIDRSAWTAWVGAVPGRHDFRAGAYAIEAKGTKRSQSKTVEISAIDQLAEPAHGELMLVHHVLEADAGGPLTVPSLAATLLSMVDHAQGFTIKLRAAGYDAEASEKWDQFRFSSMTSDAYRVVSGFPRLIPSDFDTAELPHGVSHFRYRVDLGAAAHFRLDNLDVDAFFDKLVACLSPK